MGENIVANFLYFKATVFLWVQWKAASSRIFCEILLANDQRCFDAWIFRCEDDSDIDFPFSCYLMSPSLAFVAFSFSYTLHTIFIYHLSPNSPIEMCKLRLGCCRRLYLKSAIVWKVFFYTQGNVQSWYWKNHDIVNLNLIQINTGNRKNLRKRVLAGIWYPHPEG